MEGRKHMIERKHAIEQKHISTQVRQAYDLANSKKKSVKSCIANFQGSCLPLIIIQKH